MGKDRKIQSGMDFDGDTSYRVHTKREAAGTCGKWTQNFAWFRFGQLQSKFYN